MVLPVALAYRLQTRSSPAGFSAYVVLQRKARLNDASLACPWCCLAMCSVLFITRGAIALAVAWFPGYQGCVTLSSGAVRDP
ncbi:hypothetical protein NDU88_004458 [Pleurodeles waltl]|uniref:Uncharacterized protein n=1 Tax=Pleurodeles waltl TaxID=8319 RepID=A0AAV7WAF6_PLEWA|nr:hypothetical protein NDU88_004458 [Pleurodeles waltl]